MSDNYRIPGQQNVADALCIGGIQGSKSVSTSPILACVGDENKYPRKILVVHNTSKTSILYWTFDVNGTASEGFPIGPQGIEKFMVNPGMNIYLVTRSGTITAVIGEAI